MIHRVTQIFILKTITISIQLWANVVPSVLVFHVSVNGRPSVGETVMQDAVELNQVYRKMFFPLKLSCIDQLASMYINQQDAHNSCDQTLFSIRCSACFGLYQSIIRSNFISCTSHLVHANTCGCCVAIATQQP